MKFYPEYYKRILDIFNEHTFFTDFDYNFSKIENQQLIANFTSTLQTKEKIGKHYFLSRDLVSIGLSEHINELIDKNENFLLYKLPCNDIIVSDEFKEIRIKDRLGDDLILSIDDIDHIVLLELTEPIYYRSLIEKLKTHLDEDVTNSEIDSFISMIKDRIVFFASRKVLSILHTV